MLLEVKDLSFSYFDGNIQRSSFELRDISFDVQTGDFVSVIGKNGSGKSTLVKLISRIIKNYSGRILYKGTDTTGIDIKEFARNVSYLPQSLSDAGDDLAVKDFLLLGRYAHKRFADFSYSENDKKIVEESMKITSIGNFANRCLHELSGGEKQKVFITLSLVQLDVTSDLTDKVLLIDEPITYLDINHQFEIFDVLKKLTERKLTVIIVIHDLNLALRYSNKTALLSSGRLIKYSDTKDAITEDMLKEHFLIDSKIMNFEKNFFINYFP